MKKISLGLAFILLLGFQALKADQAPKEADLCKSLQNKCQAFSLKVEQDLSQCEPCHQTCKIALSVCSKETPGKKNQDTLDSLSAHHLQCTNVCGKSSPSKEKKGSDTKPLPTS